MDYLPDMSRGYLPLVVLIVGITAVTNALQCYRDQSYLQRLYNPPSSNRNPPAPPGTKSTDFAALKRSPISPLAARLFGTWNIGVGLVRLFAAYNMDQKSWYTMSLLTNVIGLTHFGLEAFVYKTALPKGPWLAPVGTATVGVVWHIVEWGKYF